MFLFRVKRSFEENDFDSSSDETSAEIPLKQNQRKSKVKGKPKKISSNYKIIEFQNDHCQQIRGSQICDQEFMQQLITQQREDDASKGEKTRQNFLFKTQKKIKGLIQFFTYSLRIILSSSLFCKASLFNLLCKRPCCSY